jgi:predicted glycosyltransferase
VLLEAAPFVALLKAVDAVVSAGGTMAREAAYLGVPAYSIFRSCMGAVDRHLELLGRLSLLRSPEDFSRLDLGPRRSIHPLRTGSGVIDEVTEMITERVPGRNPD